MPQSCRSQSAGKGQGPNGQLLAHQPQLAAPGHKKPFRLASQGSQKPTVKSHPRCAKRYTTVRALPADGAPLPGVRIGIRSTLETPSGLSAATP